MTEGNTDGGEGLLDVHAIATALLIEGRGIGFSAKVEGSVGVSLCQASLLKLPPKCLLQTFVLDRADTAVYACQCRDLLPILGRDDHIPTAFALTVRYMYCMGLDVDVTALELADLACTKTAAVGQK